MNKKFTKLIAALALLVFMAPSMVGWGQTRDNLVLTFDLTSNPGDWPTSNSNTLTNYTYTLGGETYTFALKNVKQNSGYLMMTATAVLGLPAIEDYKLTQVVASNSSQCSTATKVGISSSSSSASYIDGGAIQTWSATSSSYTYNLTSTEANTMYYMYVTNKNAQVIQLQLTYAPVGSSTDPFCTINPTAWNIGNVQAGSAAQTKNFSVTTANLTDNLAVELLYGTYYSVNVSSIGQGETSKTITVTLNPTAVGPMEDVLMITGGGITDIEVDLTATGLCNNPTTALAYPTPGDQILTNGAVSYTLTPTANTGNGGPVTYSIPTNPGNKGEIQNNNIFHATGIGQYVVHAEQPLYGTICAGSADITINVFGPNQTITFNAGSGTCTTPSMTQNEGKTITLPTATPSEACASRGWTFAGWAASEVSETTTAPTILLAAGENYTVTTSETLYAVYMQGGSSTCSVTFSESGYTNQQTITEAQIGNCATATFDKGTNSNAPKYYTNGEAIRCYGGNTITITGEALTEIVLTFGTEDGSNTITTNVGSYSNGTWTGSANSVTFTIGGTTGNRRIAAIDVTLGGTITYNTNPSCLEQVATPVITLAEGTYTEVKTTTITCETEGATIYYTTDGTDPTTSSIQYTIGTNITIGQSMTLKAIAVKENMENSNIASATYTINIQYTLTINNENGNIRDIHVFDDPTGIEPILYIDGYSGEELTEASIDAGTVIYVSVGGVVDCKVFDALTVTCGGSPVTPSYDGDSDMYSFTLNGNTNIAVSATDAEEYTLTVAGLEHVSFEMLVGAESSTPTSLDANHQATVCEQVLVEITNLTVGNGFSLQSVTLDNETITLENGVYAFNMPSRDATLTFNTEVMNAPYYALYSGDLVEGDYLIVYNGKAMNTTVSSDRLQYEEVTPDNNGNVFVTNDDNIVWHIAQSGDYWTIYNAAVNSYAAATGSRNQAQLLSEGTDDKALWTATGNTTYEFENKARAAATSYPGNKWLRNNGTNGFACYSDQTGGALSLYKKVTPQNYTTMEIQPNQWYFIASPTGTSPTNVEVLSDLYYYDEQDHYWRNQKVFANSNGFINFDRGQGFLCANAGESAEPVTLTFMGGLLDGNTKTVALEYHATTTENEENTLAGWNLVGNPFTSNAHIDRSYYVIEIDDETGKNIIVASEGGAIAPYIGVMVQAESTEDNVTFTRNAPANPSNGNLQMTVAHQATTRGTSATIDNAILSFNEGSQLGKFYFGENDANLYIPQGNKEYAIATSDGQGEMPLNFRANENGQYTLTVNPEGVEMNYLHLIDNMTGNDIDLLQTPSYSFNAKTTDYESRFRLVFAANNESGVSASSTTFAFYSNGNWMVNNEGEATLQVIDVMGRVLSSQTISGTAELNLNQQVGVYVLRLVNGNDVKTQKIVVK